MKTKLSILLTSAIVVLLTSCSGDELKVKKAELIAAKKEQTNINKKIKELEDAIAKLDTTKKEIDLGTSVEVITLNRKQFTHTFNVQGVVEASKNILANPEASGRILTIQVKEGQKVSKGQTIATIDASILQNNINELKKSLEFATTMFEKQEKLNKKGVGTEVQYLEAKNRKESLEKSLATLNSQLSKYIVKAPISGYIDEIMPKVGEMASPQAPITRIINLEKVFVEADVSEAFLGKINEQDVVTVHFKDINKKVGGKIVQLGQYINPFNRTFKIKIDLDEQNALFKPNLLAVVTLTDYKSDSTISIPTNTVQDDLKGNFVYVQENKIAKKKYVELGITNTSETEILGGLSENETIIVKGHKGLVDGEMVNAIARN